MANCPATTGCGKSIELLVPVASLPSIETLAQWQQYQPQAIERLKNTTFRYTLAGSAPNLRDVRADGSDGTSTVRASSLIAAIA